MKQTVSRVTLGVLLAVILATAAGAQMPGMEDDAKRAGTPSPTQSAQPDGGGAVERYYRKFMGPQSPYRPVILVVLTLLVVLQLKRYLTKVMQAKVKEQAFEEDNAKAFMKVWNNVWKFVIAILVLIAMSGSLRLLGLTAGFLGMMLGWSLQQPVTGIAAWLMIVLKKPFRIGDRVIIAGITGDVTAISLTHVVLNQVGGTVGGEERSGRGILIPNAILFQHVIINFTLDEKYTLSEIPVRLNHDCDWERAKEIMLDVAAEVTADVIKDTGSEPVIRVELLDWGLLARLRFKCIPTEREQVGTRVVEKLISAFRKEYPRIRFAVPHSRIDYENMDHDKAPPVTTAK